MKCRGPLLYLVLLIFSACKKDHVPPRDVPGDLVPASFSFNILKVNGLFDGFTYYNINDTPVVRFSFSAPLDRSSIDSGFSWRSKAGAAVPFDASFMDNDSTVVLRPAAPLQPITIYGITASEGLRSRSGGALQTAVKVELITAIDSTDKFPRISDSALLDLVERRTFRYFWDFGHPVSGMARERSTSGDVVTTGGSGFGVMAILAGIHRHFISRAEGLGHISKIVDFLTGKAQRYHGAFPHWMNGATGATIPFSPSDNGADLVETAYLMQGLLCARQYFNNAADSAETALRKSINDLWNGVEWSWFRQNGQNVLYWHWSPDKGWAINLPVKGWNEALIVYVLAASANSGAIPKIVYDEGWAGNGAMKNGQTYFGIPLPLGPDYGGPLFFAHYSFLGLDPHGLSDAYANYWSQNTAHAEINYAYCVANPHHYNGYSRLCWGLTASDDNISGYAAHSPVNDVGVISPTAAIASLPYTPAKSMDALRFFYYQLGDKLWGPYGFKDAFNLTDVWFADTYLAIDQGPEIVMIENYRSGLLWSLFMSCPEIRRGLEKLGFS